MRQVALISQPLRANYCQAYVDSSSDETVIITSDASTFDEIQFESPQEILTVTPPPALLPSRRLTRGRLYRSVLKRARSGSTLGRWLEKWAKRLAWRLRYVDRLSLLRKQGKGDPVAADSLRGTAIFEELVRLHHEAPLGRLVVFDLFDLPVALRFGVDNDLEVIVR